MSALCRLLIDGCVGCGDRCFVVTWQRFHHVSRVLPVLRRWMLTVTSATRERGLKMISSRRLYILRYTLYCSSQSSSDHITDCGIRGAMIKYHCGWPLCYTAKGMGCTHFTVVPILTRPFLICGTVKWVSAIVVASAVVNATRASISNKWS